MLEKTRKLMVESYEISHDAHEAARNFSLNRVTVYNYINKKKNNISLDSIRKVIYMSVREISKKWTMPIKNWRLAYAQFMIFLKIDS